MKIKKYILDEVDSTNLYAKKVALETNEDVLIVANKQTAGKGRMGRKFFSPEGGLYMSLLLHPSFGIEKISNITAMAAVAVARSIDKVCKVKSYIKWVNDIYVDNKKVCGILTEGSFDSENKRFSFCVLGIGINIFNPDIFPDDLKEIAGSLHNHGNFRNALIEETINNFYLIYNSNDCDYINEYKRRSNVLGKNITYFVGDKIEKGIAIDITSDANLVVKTPDGIKYYGSGEIKIDKQFLKG